MTDILNLPRPTWMTEDVVLLEDQARRFIAAEFVPHLDQWHDDHFYPRDVWTKAGQAGLLCAAMPEEYGGAGGTFAHEAVINREYSLAGFDTNGAPLHSGIVAPYILHYGTEEQKRRWLPKLASGEMVGAIAMSEPGTGSDLQGVRTSARRSGNGYVLNGSKTFITNGQHADLIVVVAKTDPKQGSKGVSLIVVETAHRKETLWAMEEAVRSQAPAAVVGLIDQLDLKLSQRLHLAAVDYGLPLLLIRPAHDLESSAAATRWRVGTAEAARDRFGLITRPRWHLHLERVRNGRPGEWVVEYDHVAHRFSLAATLADPAHARGASQKADRQAHCA